MQRQLKNHEVKLRDLQNGKIILTLCFEIKLNTDNFELTFTFWSDQDRISSFFPLSNSSGADSFQREVPIPSDLAVEAEHHATPIDQFSRWLFNSFF